MFFRISVISLLIVLSPASNAVDWVLLQHDSLIGDSPGLDLLWGTADDFNDIAGLNPAGGATTFGETSGGLGGFGFLTGTSETNSSGPQVFGENTISDLTNLGVYTNNFAVQNLTFTQNLVGVGTVSNFPNNLTTAEYVLDQPDPVETTTQDVTSIGSWITPGDDPAVLFPGSDGLIAHYNFLMGLLPNGWTVLATSIDSYTTSSTNIFFNGVTGATSVVQYSLDPNAVPAPVPVPAMLPIFLFGLARLFRWRRAC